MKAAVVTLLTLFSLAACSSSDAPSGTPDAPGGPGAPDASNPGTGQRVVTCNGTLRTGEASACPHGDCDETSASQVSCGAYASFVPGATTGLCAAGATSTYALKFKKPSETTVFYEVVECTSGAATLHACAFGYTTTPSGFGGRPGFVCTN